MRLRQLIPEDLRNNTVPLVHRNIGINSLKNVAKASERGSARFTITNDGNGKHSITAGDSGHFLHNDLIPNNYWNKDENRKLPIGGYISHKEGKFHYSAYQQGDSGSFHRIDDHPVLNKMRDEHGIEKGIWSPKGRGVRQFQSDDERFRFEDRGLLEALLDQVHNNVSISTLKSIAKQSQYKVARFIIAPDNTLHGGNGDYYLHSSMHRNWTGDNNHNESINGEITHQPDETYHFKIRNRSDDFQHPHLDRLEKQGIKRKYENGAMK